MAAAAKPAAAPVADNVRQLMDLVGRLGKRGKAGPKDKLPQTEAVAAERSRPSLAAGR